MVPHSDIRPGMISLREAVVRAHQALFADVIQPSDEAFDAIAMTLIRYVQVYRLEAEGREPVALTEPELASGRFIEGAARFDFGNDEPSAANFAVSEADLNRAFASLASVASPKRTATSLPIGLDAREVGHPAR